MIFNKKSTPFRVLTLAILLFIAVGGISQINTGITGGSIGGAVSAAVTALVNLFYTSNKTFYVCGKAAGGTCGSTDTSNGFYNGGSGYIQTGSYPQDNASCGTAPTTACASIAGVLAVIGKVYLAASLPTIYFADTVNTGTDCYSANNVTFFNPSMTGMAYVTSEASTGTSGTWASSFPAYYLYLYGNPTTPTNVTIAGSGGCGVSTAGSWSNGLSFVNTVWRMNGFRFEGYGRSGSTLAAAVNSMTGSVGFMDNITNTGASGNGVAAGAAFGSGAILRMGGTWVDTNSTHTVIAAYGGIVYTWDPLASVSANTTLTVSGTHSHIFTAQVDGQIFFDRITYSLTGTITDFLFAFGVNSGIWYDESYPTTVCPGGFCVNGTLNATLTNYQQVDEFGYIDAYCTTANESSCTVTQQPTLSSLVNTGGAAREYPTLSAITATGQYYTGGCIFSFYTNNATEAELCGPGITFSGNGNAIVVYGAGQSDSGNAAALNTIFKGGEVSSAGGSSSAGGYNWVRGGNNAATNASSKAGSLMLSPGLSTGASNTGQMGMGSFALSYKKGTTVTKWNLECWSAAMTVADCGATPVLILGVDESVNTVSARVITLGQTPINASAAVTVGDTVCADSTAGVVTDSGGTALCVAKLTVGQVIAVAGTYILGDGSSVTLSTTLPLVQLKGQ